MHLTIFQILIFTSCFSYSLALNWRSAVSKRHHNSIAKRGALYGEDPVEMTKRSDTKYVFMHHVGSALTDISFLSDVMLRLLAVRVCLCRVLVITHDISNFLFKL
jgi:hypothetical protein